MTNKKLYLLLGFGLKVYKSLKGLRSKDIRDILLVLEVVRFKQLAFKTTQYLAEAKNYLQCVVNSNMLCHRFFKTKKQNSN